MRLVVCGAVLTVCVLAWAIGGDATGRIAAHLALYGAAFAAYLVALHGASGLSTRGLRTALGLAVLWRALLVAAPPLLSDDVNRYVWEGRVQLRGGNPYAWDDRPEALRWRSLRDAVWDGVNHKDYTAVYPPFWQLAAAAVVAVHDSLAAMKAFLVLCELATLAVLARLLSRRGLPKERLLIFAWSPLALVEIAGSGHNEPLAMLCFVVALAALEARRPLASALAAALALQAKLLPGIVALAWGRRYRPRHVLAGLGLAALLVIPYARAGAGLWRSLGRYGSAWRFNETLFALLALVSGSHRRAAATAAVLVALFALLLAWRRSEAVGAALAVIVAWLLLAPSVLPWYALWLLPLIVLRDCPGALLFTGTIGLAYLVYPGWQSGEVWQIGWGLRALEYGPCLVVWLRAWIASGRPRL